MAGIVSKSVCRVRHNVWTVVSSLAQSVMEIRNRQPWKSVQMQVSWVGLSSNFNTIQIISVQMQSSYKDVHEFVQLQLMNLT